MILNSLFRSSSRIKIFSRVTGIWAWSCLCVLLALGICALFLTPALALEEEVVVTEPILPIQQFDVGLSSSLKAAQGTFDNYGIYTAYPNGSESISYMTTLKADYRFSQRWDAGFALPIRQSELQLPTGSRESTTLGGAQLSGRYHAGTGAHIVVHGGIALPWKWSSSKVVGTPAASIAPDTGSDSMPNGTSVHLGVGTSHTFGRIRLAYDFTTTYAFASTPNFNDGSVSDPNVSVRPGMRYSIREGVSYALDQNWFIDAGLNQMWIMDTHVNGVDSDGTGSRAFTTTVGVGYKGGEKWRINVAYETSFPFYGYEVNLPYAPTFSFGLTYLSL